MISKTCSQEAISSETVPCAALSLTHEAFNNPYLKAIELPQLPLGDPGSVSPEIARRSCRRDRVVWRPLGGWFKCASITSPTMTLNRLGERDAATIIERLVGNKDFRLT
jgi:hypothetical protein